MGTTLSDVVDGLDGMEVSLNISLYKNTVPFRSDKLTHLDEVFQVCLIKASGHVVGDQSLHEEGDTEDIHAMLSKSIDLVGIGPSVISALFRCVSLSTHLKSR